MPPTSADFFTWSRSTGLARSSLTAGDVVYVYSSEIGLIGGETELGTDPDNPQCGGFTWNIATRTLQEYPTFCARWMNKGGVMVGRMQDGRLATVSPDDGLQVPDSNLPPVFTTMFITDDDEIFVDLAKDTEDLKAGAAVVANGEAINIGRGLAVAPPDFILDREFAAWIRVSSNGHAIGRDTLTAPPGCFPPFVAEFFEWNRASGATPIRVEGRTAIQPRDVNRDGVVVGRVDEGTPDSRAFVWTRESGGVLLDALVSNMPAGRSLGRCRCGRGRRPHHRRAVERGWVSRGSADARAMTVGGYRRHLHCRPRPERRPARLSRQPGNKEEVGVEHVEPGKDQHQAAGDLQHSLRTPQARAAFEPAHRRRTKDDRDGAANTESQ